MGSEKRFQRKKEDFICEKCRTMIKGEGYTDHCSKCLWSKHVDLNPGDRRESCKGLMEPVGVEIKKGEHFIHYRCVRCKYRHRVKSDKEDNLEEIIKLSENKI